MIIGDRFPERQKNGEICYYVFRRCDQCGKEEKARFDIIRASRKKRGKDTDFCWICANKNRTIPKGDKHKNFKHGISQSGYKRITVNGKRYYEHKFVIESNLGRKVLKNEVIHHIDCDKLNNLLSNLCLYPKKFHAKIHKQIEELGFSLFNIFIWFSEKSKKYVLCKTNRTVIEPIDISIYEPKNNKKIKTSKYIFRKIDGQSIALHTCIMEKVIGRKLYRNECVHHINGDTYNNNVNNLILMNWAEHRFCHKSLQHCVAELYKKNIVSFDRENGNYFLVEKKK